MSDGIAGRLCGVVTPIAPTRLVKRGSTVWLIQCLCGRTRLLPRHRFFPHGAKSCGRDCPFFQCVEVLWGREYDKLKVLRVPPRIRGGMRSARRYWFCLCRCGVIRWVSQQNLKSGHATSCGCSRYDREQLQQRARQMIRGAHGRWAGIRK